jgi:hypothetical protein
MTDDSDDIPAGWYPDSEGTIRWWDGGQWTENVQQPSGDSAPTVVMPADRSTAAGHRAGEHEDEEPDHRRRTWLTATVVGLLAFFLGLGIGSGGGGDAETPVGEATSSSGATVQELDQREEELRQRDEALKARETELNNREEDLDRREQDLAGSDSDAETFIDDGTVEVGQDVQPGTYATLGAIEPDSSSCTYLVSTDEEGTDIISQDETQGEAEVTLEVGQFFTTRDCLPWELQ